MEWEITFLEEVGDSFTNADLRIMEVPAANIVVMPNNGVTRTIKVSGYDGYQGTLTLQLAQNHIIRDETGIINRQGNRLDTAYQFTSNNTFRVDRKNPEIMSLTRLSPTTRNADNATELKWMNTILPKM